MRVDNVTLQAAILEHAAGNKTAGAVAVPCEGKGLGPADRASSLTELEGLTADLLRRRWQGVMRTAPPRGLTRLLMIRILAWREQVNATGELDGKILRGLNDALRPGTGAPLGKAVVAPTNCVPGWCWYANIAASITEGCCRCRRLWLEQSDFWKPLGRCSRHHGRALERYTGSLGWIGPLAGPVRHRSLRSSQSMGDIPTSASQPTDQKDLSP